MPANFRRGFHVFAVLLVLLSLSAAARAWTIPPVLRFEEPPPEDLSTNVFTWTSAGWRFGNWMDLAL